ncbi:MAG: 2-oxo-4-hydroxy-4-carboxy-5-ureidoimidazoline decarboxylase [Gemmatimonadaceae bacterium]
MSISVRDLDELPESEAADALRSCCGAPRWVDGMVNHRPFRTLDSLLASADEVWAACGERDWRDAFAHHPRIGGDHSDAGQNDQASQWASSEQSGIAESGSTVRSELAQVNRDYENRFGHIYIVCATGRSADEMLAIARERLDNDAATELRTAAGEQRRITALRLKKLVGDKT